MSDKESSAAKAASPLGVPDDRRELSFSRIAQAVITLDPVANVYLPLHHVV